MSYCAVDTNVIIYYLNQVGGDDYRKYFDRIVSRGAVISVITRIEVLSWPGYSGNLIALADAEDLLSTLREEPLTELVIQVSITLRRAYRVKVPDAIVAATAQTLALPLITRNTDDFKRIPSLVLLDPFLH